MEHQRPERYIKNPRQVLRGMAELALKPVRLVDNALYEFDDHRPYNETNYPRNWITEAPVATEEELWTP